MNQGLLQVEACVIQGPIANDSGEFVSKVSAHDKETNGYSTRIMLQEERLSFLNHFNRLMVVTETIVVTVWLANLISSHA